MKSSAGRKLILASLISGKGLTIGTYRHSTKVITSSRYCYLLKMSIPIQSLFVLARDGAPNILPLVDFGKEMKLEQHPGFFF
jgi:hypothetical protein